MGMLGRQGYGEEEIREQVWLREVQREGHAAHRRRSAAHMKADVDKAIGKAGAGAGAAAAGEDGTEGVADGEEVASQIMVYDHSQCNDCGCVHSMVTECVMQLAAKTLQVA